MCVQSGLMWEEDSSFTVQKPKYIQSLECEIFHSYMSTGIVILHTTSIFGHSMVDL